MTLRNFPYMLNLDSTKDPELLLEDMEADYEGELSKGINGFYNEQAWDLSQKQNTYFYGVLYITHTNAQLSIISLWIWQLQIKLSFVLWNQIGHSQQQLDINTKDYISNSTKLNTQLPDTFIWSTWDSWV